MSRNGNRWESERGSDAPKSLSGSLTMDWLHGKKLAIQANATRCPK